MKILIKKRIKKVTAILAIIILPMTLIGQDSPITTDIELADEPAVVLGGKTISMGDAVKMAIKNNYDILSGAYDVAMTDTLYKQLQKKYSFYLNAGGGYAYSKNIPSSMAGIFAEDSKTIDANVSLSKMFSTGTQISGGLNHQYTKTTPTPTIQAMMPDSPAEYYSPVLFVNIQQELLKNTFGKNDRLQDKIALNTAKMQKDVILQTLSIVVVGVIVDYWNVVITKTNMENNELLLDRTKRVRTIVQRNVNLGLVDSFQINYYNALVANSEATLARAKKNYASALRAFLSTINVSSDEIAAGKMILSDKLIDLNEEEALKIAFAKRADYQRARLAIDNAKMNLDMIGNSGMPSLTASLQVQSLGQEEKMGTAYNKAYGLNYPAVSGRLALSHALDDSDQKVRERNASFQLKQAEIALEQVRRNISDDIKNQIDNINASYIEYKSARESRIESETYYNKMINNLLKGRLDSATVKNGLDAFVMSRQAEINALVGYNISLFQFLVAKNQLWEKFDIDVEEYIPKYE
jgi:outer membrane protein TolC